MDLIDFALACYRTPLAYQDQLALSAPLPEGMDRLLWLANGSPEALGAAVFLTSARPQELQDAARFCIQQLCFVQGADSYRVLGLKLGAAPERIKEHHRLLMRLFHPDRASARETWTDCYATRINQAWTALSRPESQGASRMPWPPRQAGVEISNVNPLPGRSTRPAPQSGFSHTRTRFIALPRWLSRLVFSGLALVVTSALVLGGLYLVMHQDVQAPLFSVMPAAHDTNTLPAAPDHSAISAFLIKPDWQMLDRREWPSQPQPTQYGQSSQLPEPVNQEQLVVEESLLERVREERIQLEAQLKTEQARMEQEWTKHQVAAQRLEQLQADRTQTEQAQAEQLALAQQQLEKLRIEQVQAAQLANELRTERQRLTWLKAKSAEFGQAAPEEPLTVESVYREVAAGNSPESRELAIQSLNNLIDRYTIAYQQGDLNRIMTLFVNQEHGRDAEDWQRLRQRYAKLFTTHMIQKFKVYDLFWNIRSDSASGVAHYQLWLRRRRGGGIKRVDGDIRFEVRRQGDQCLIDAVDQETPEKQ